MIHLTRKKDYACPRCGETRLEACSVLCLSNELQFQNDPEYTWVREYDSNPDFPEE